MANKLATEWTRFENSAVGLLSARAQITVRTVDTFQQWVYTGITYSYHLLISPVIFIQGDRIRPPKRKKSSIPLVIIINKNLCVETFSTWYQYFSGLWNILVWRVAYLYCYLGENVKKLQFTYPHILPLFLRTL